MSEPVRPVSDEVVAATLLHLPHHVRVIVELMTHTGMRPSEACRLTLDRRDLGREVWVYRPPHQKYTYTLPNKKLPARERRGVSPPVRTRTLLGPHRRADAPPLAPEVNS